VHFFDYNNNYYYYIYLHCTDIVTMPFTIVKSDVDFEPFARARRVH